MSYYTIEKAGHSIYEEKKSKFLGEAIPVSSEEDITSHLNSIRKRYYDARHHCYAYVLGEKRDGRKASDDGEPSGTAGLPILKVIDGAECTGILVVVTRYFGGTLLGTGGLVRAYTSAAQMALADAGPVCMEKGEVLELSMEYGFLDSVTHYLKQAGIAVRDMQYTDRVVVNAVVRADEADAVRQKLQGLSAGRIRIRSAEQGYYGF